MRPRDWPRGGIGLAEPPPRGENRFADSATAESPTASTLSSPLTSCQAGHRSRWCSAVKTGRKLAAKHPFAKHAPRQLGASFGQRPHQSITPPSPRPRSEAVAMSPPGPARDRLACPSWSPKSRSENVVGRRCTWGGMVESSAGTVKDRNPLSLPAARGMSRPMCAGANGRWAQKCRHFCCPLPKRVDLVKIVDGAWTCGRGAETINGG